MTEIDYAEGMTWFDVPVEYPTRPKSRRRETLRLLALDADTARREAEDDVWNRLHCDPRSPQYPVPGADYVIGDPASPVRARRSGGAKDWIVSASINDHGDSHGTVLFGPYESAEAAEADAQYWILRHQARLGYCAAIGEIVPIVRRTTIEEAAHPQRLTRPEALLDPPPVPGRYATATADRSAEAVTR
jgi:hypothetical protein